MLLGSGEHAPSAYRSVRRVKQRPAYIHLVLPAYVSQPTMPGKPPFPAGTLAACFFPYRAPSKTLISSLGRKAAYWLGGVDLLDELEVARNGGELSWLRMFVHMSREAGIALFTTAKQLYLVPKVSMSRSLPN